MPAPIGLELARTARTVSGAFDRAMTEAGGSAATWQVLLLVRSKEWGQQSQMAAALGISGPTLTHHLAALERRGLVRRWREEDNRRVQRVEITDAGVVLFDRLRGVAQRFDRRLRSALGEGEREQLADMLGRLAAKVGGEVREPVATRGA